MTPPKITAVLNAEQMRERLAQVGRPAAGVSVGGPAAVGVARLRLRERVVLLDYFDPRMLEDPTSGERELSSFTTQDCELVTTRQGSGWRLLLEVRRSTLTRMGVAAVLSSLHDPAAVAPAGDDVTHRMALRLLTGNRELQGLSSVELSCMLRSIAWLEPMGLELPSEPDIRRSLDLANVLAPLHSVATPDFVGRERELEMLQSHLFDETADAPVPLAIHGPGGVGKSTLLAEFVLDRVQDSSKPILFSYLSFDRAELDPQFPLTLLSEMCRQVGLQSPTLAEPMFQVRGEIDRVLIASSALRAESAVSRGSAAKDSFRRTTDEDFVIGYFNRVLSSAGARTPLLLVLDTFEVAQRRRRSSLHHLDAMLATLRRHVRQLRVVIAGRAEVDELQTRNVSLGGLDPSQATALLRSALNGLGVQDALVHDVVTKVSGNPLSLRLAADLMKREGPQVLATRRGRRRLLFDLTAEQVQGVLYRRILEHVDPAIRPLANPGLVVRRITRDVIAQVLAEPCGLGPLSDAQADRLFELLESDVSLVTEARPGVLVHRADVRREMLPLLDAEDHARVVDIHHRAVGYYQDRRQTDDQIEHLYHRLMLGESSSTLDRYWQSGVGPFLETSMPELPPESRVYLAGKLNIEADRADLLAADQTAWVRQVTRQSRALLDAGQPREAWALLTGKATSPRDLAISRLIIEALASQGRHEDALRAVREAITDADQRGLAVDFVQLNILGGRVAEDAGDYQEARRLFSEAHESAGDLGIHIDSLSAGVGVLRLLRRSGILGSVSASSQLRQQLIAEAGLLTDRDKSLHPGLLRELAAELGTELPGLLAEASANIGIETEGESAGQLPPESHSVLRDVVEEGLRGISGASPYPGSRPHLPVAEPGIESDVTDESSPPPVVPPPVRTPSEPASSSAQGSVISEALINAPDDDNLRESLSQYWQSEADRPSFDFDTEPPEPAR